MGNEARTHSLTVWPYDVDTSSLKVMATAVAVQELLAVKV
jgi:hypothetical protein